MAEIDYKFNEDKYIAELKEYIDKTYGQHYAQDDGIQTLEFIKSMGDYSGFCKGNAIKYLSRYGKKEGKNRKDLIKTLHYVLLLLDEE
ncbi:MAG: DUF3310 domain-containing protein [Candidatus Thiodiazotropha taylori]|uniref:DUF3310 domain-containing protein n=1 Tax=Candidatus Thiodiazotropha taylori TaxID=2792791 RepID=A0A9E4N201_9GAMM|nr:DUF3310 domain-containing protein [Candidatus Thiodiazotropha taylori]MCW4254915.1 DUF3310 domain-containing protein [Candidatus Thiodiazotropha taylori]